MARINFMTKPENPVEARIPYFLICTNTPDELSEKVSASLQTGAAYLHGQPFVFKDQICQCLKGLSYG
jgi:hypothetical protein